MREAETVRLRYIGIPFNGAEVPGLCFEFSSREGAQSFFGHLHSYLIAPASQRYLQLHVDTAKKASWSVKLQIQGPSLLFTIEIENVEDHIIARLLEHLQAVLYYVILGGYTMDESVELLPPRSHHFFKRDLWLNGEHILGTETKPLKWDDFVNQLPGAENEAVH